MPPLNCIRRAKEIAEKSHENLDDSNMETEKESDLLQSKLMRLLKLKIRSPQKTKAYETAKECHTRPKFKISASGIDLESSIKSKEVRYIWLFEILGRFRAVLGT